MEYSAGTVSCLFWYTETQKTAELILQNKTLEEIRQIANDENIYQVRAADRARRIAGVCYKRLVPLGEEIQKEIAYENPEMGKIMLLIGIMKTDLLFYEFMHLVVKHAILIGTKRIEDVEVNNFFEDKIRESEVVARFSDSAIYKLKQTYVKMLVEAGFVDNTKDKNILVPFISERIISMLRKMDLLPYLSCINGVEYNV